MLPAPAQVFKDTSGLEAAKVSGVRKVPALHFYLGGGKIDEFIGGSDVKNDIAKIEQRVNQHKVAARCVFGGFSVLAYLRRYVRFLDHCLKRFFSCLLLEPCVYERNQCVA